MRKLIPVFIILIYWLACKPSTDISVVPDIEFIGISKDTVDQNVKQNDSIFILLRFKDGDGDIGFNNNDANIFIEDMRDGYVIKYASPVIPGGESLSDVSGTIQLLINTQFNVCCKYASGQQPCTPALGDQLYDVMRYSIYIVDRAGNESNRVETSPIVIRCN